MKKKIIFRADGNSTTGLGHLYRLFSLAEVVKDSFHFIFLVKADTPKNIFPNSYRIDSIPESISYDKEPNWIAEKYTNTDYTIVADGYAFGSEYQKILKEKGYKLIYIDDLANEFMHADIVINHSPYIKENDYQKSNNTTLALGIKYALLRPMFLRQAKKQRLVNKIDTAFVCFGGSDPFNLTVKATEALAKIETIENIHIVLGSSYLNKNTFTDKNQVNSKVTIHQNLNEEDLINVMQSCNFGIVPSSTILYELCCVKMPILSGYFVDNQILINKGFENHGVIINAGNIQHFTSENFLNYIRRIIEQKNYTSIIKNQEKLFDGKSKERLLNLISKLC